MTRLSHIIICAAMLSLIACAKDKPSVLDMPNETYQEGERIFADYGGYKWVCLPEEEEDFVSEFFSIIGLEDVFSLSDYMSRELGKPFAVDDAHPSKLSEYNNDICIFGLPNCRDLESDEHLYWWEEEQHIIRLYICLEQAEIGMPTFAVIAIFNVK